MQAPVRAAVGQSLARLRPSPLALPGASGPPAATRSGIARAPSETLAAGRKGTSFAPPGQVVKRPMGVAAPVRRRPGPATRRPYETPAFAAIWPTGFKALSSGGGAASPPLSGGAIFSQAAF